MTSIPSFAASGFAGEKLANTSAGNFLKFEDDKPLRIYFMHEFAAPAGEEETGNNGVIAYRQMAIYKDDARFTLPEDVNAVTFPDLGDDAGEVGRLLGLKPNFRALAIVGIDGDDSGKEYVWAFSNAVHKQLAAIASEANLKGVVLKITRSGKGFKTKYSIVQTNKRIDVKGEPATDLVDYLGEERTREDIIAKLVELDCGLWPPEGGDPFAKKIAPKTTKPKTSEPVVATEDEYESV